MYLIDIINCNKYYYCLQEGYKSPDTSRDDNKTIQDDWGNWEEVKTSQTTPTTSSRRGPLRPSKSPQAMEQDTSVYLTPNESTNNKSSGKQVNNTSSIPVPVTTSTPTKTTGKVRQSIYSSIIYLFIL